MTEIATAASRLPCPAASRARRPRSRRAEPQRPAFAPRQGCSQVFVHPPSATSIVADPTVPNSLAASASAATFRAIVLAVACLAALSATWGGNQPLFAQEAAPRGVNSSDEADEAPAFDPRGPRVIIAPDD